MPAFGRLPLAYEYVRQGKHTTIIFKFQIPRKKRVEFTRLDTKNINMEGLVTRKKIVPFQSWKIPLNF